MGLGSRYLRVAGRHREEAAPVVGFRFRYLRAVEYGGTVGAAGAIGRTEAPILVRDLGARPHRGTTIVAWRAHSPSSPRTTSGAPLRALGLDRSAPRKQRGPSCHQYGGAPRPSAPE
jgi:hypothetical protein